MAREKISVDVGLEKWHPGLGYTANGFRVDEDCELAGSIDANSWCYATGNNTFMPAYVRSKIGG